MTKHNLAIHLRWLIQQGPSLYPSINPASQSRDSPDGEGDQTGIGQNDQNTAEIPGLEATATPVDDRETVLVPPPINETSGDGEGLTSNRDMARLVFAPQTASSSTRRMLSQPGSIPMTAPVTPGSHPVAESPLQHRAFPV